MWSHRALWIGRQGGEEALATLALSPAAVILVGKKNDMMSIQHQSSTTESRYYLLSIRGSLRIEGEKYDIQKTYVCRQVLYYML